MDGLSAADLDGYFGQHLLMHVFPMAPMPLNDHSITPGNATIEGFYADHQPMFDAMRTAQWIFTANPGSCWTLSRSRCFTFVS